MLPGGRIDSVSGARGQHQRTQHWRGGRRSDIDDERSLHIELEPVGCAPHRWRIASYPSSFESSWEYRLFQIFQDTGNRTRENRQVGFIQNYSVHLTLRASRWPVHSFMFHFRFGLNFIKVNNVIHSSVMLEQSGEHVGEEWKALSGCPGNHSSKSASSTEVRAGRCK